MFSFLNTDGDNLTNALNGALANIGITSNNTDDIEDGDEPQALDEEVVPVQ